MGSRLRKSLRVALVVGVGVLAEDHRPSHDLLAQGLGAGAGETIIFRGNGLYDSDRGQDYDRGD